MLGEGGVANWTVTVPAGHPEFRATLVYADRAYGNAGPLAVREGGRLCYPSAHRAVAAGRRPALPQAV